jgi:hypothetical protein
MSFLLGEVFKVLESFCDGPIKVVHCNFLNKKIKEEFWDVQQLIKLISMMMIH